ncbi:MAG: class I SAM-dependent methyltransferase [Elusimicrobia bacterium]|nr:class I SAM-dependent methyltransferase [Elusimicrobiota bacterium]
MRPRLRRALQRTYRLGGPWPVFGPRRLRQILDRHGLDPRRAHPWVFDIESLSHFRQSGTLALFQALRIRREHRVLSLGEGLGAPSRLLAKTVGCRVTGVDLLPRQVATAREMARALGLSGRLEYLCQDAHSLDLGSRRFDRLYICDSMAHWHDKALALAGAARYLKPGALAGGNDWLAGDEGGLGDAERRVPSVRRTFERGILFQVDLKTERMAFEEAGFEVLSAEDITREVDETTRRRLEALRAYRRLLAPDELQGIGYFEVMLSLHFRFVRYCRVVARLVRR